MRYFPHTPEDITEMLTTVGVDSLDDLFATIPDECRRRNELNLPEALTEWELDNHIDELGGTMAVSPEFRVFMGAGSYAHYIPASVRHLLSRSEFVTSYTPYQPEMSQGTLQAIFEYQTLTARLLGMEVANASQYDGASALAEAALMAVRTTRRKKVAVSRLVHPHYRRVLATYLAPTDYEIVELPYLPDGTTDLAPLENLDELAAVIVQSPNFFGCVENVKTIGAKTRTGKTLLVVGFSEPLAYGMYQSPGSQGADIACGEGQSLGIPRSFGGPALGMFATLMKYVRNMPGRLVGQTTDVDGERGFVLTLATREQHIRREKATSNICTNHSLCALAAAIYMASLGGTGIRDLARLNYDKSEYLKGALRKAGFAIPFSQSTFNEFVVEFKDGFDKTYQRLTAEKIIAGLPLECYYPELANHYLLCVTETISKQDMDMLVQKLK
ncbi:MAG: aminomethyl-transferring glycine dehydrogenase subunit GcvPA [Deltaproteobacteria bacterium]|jgi:glycine dehydrogenase subunit 1|nr:aminomethyl-transferring glycine dehydrogenase subunit GcvPA [Deltaproteobacteria bacterium]MBW2482569.1 aminomethyl-transferring glycine dehydrogenase subunit GcvPA [Deltaproteobacteria bacterium]